VRRSARPTLATTSVDVTECVAERPNSHGHGQIQRLVWLRPQVQRFNRLRDRMFANCPVPNFIFWEGLACRRSNTPA
jgi:hypothetical protein